MDYYDILLAKKLSGGGGGGSTLINKNITENGTYNASSDNADGYKEVVVNVPTLVASKPLKSINFYDYDGTRVESYTVQEWANVTQLPNNPVHEGLTSQGWNYTKAQIDAELLAQPNVAVNVGQEYITSDGKTRLYCTFYAGRLSPFLAPCVNGTLEIDWGDGTTSTLTGTSINTVVTSAHTYAKEGDYVISLNPTNGSFKLVGDIFRVTASSTSSNNNRVYTSAIKKVEIGADVVFDAPFKDCASLEYIAIGKDYSGNTNEFRECRSLKFAIIPKGTEVYNSNFYGCTALQNVSIPPTVTKITASAFFGCASIQQISIPKSCTHIEGSSIRGCESLATITVPSTVSTLGTQAFCNSFGLKEIHILATTPPSIESNTFQNIPSDCVIYVPQSSLTVYQGATNWSGLTLQGE